MSKVIIIGGGPSGMMAGIAAALNKNEVHIFEKNEKLGKKLFITGKGRCNVTNASDIETIMNNIISNPKFLYSALYSFTNYDVINFFEMAGVPLKIERGNRVFPVSDKSSDIINGLIQKLKELNVNIHLNEKVTNIITNNYKFEKIVLSNNKEITGDAVIVATGGFSYKSTGSDGDGYRFAKDTHHNVTDISPALVPLRIAEYDCKEMQGLSLKNVEVSIIFNGRNIYSDMGEMLFTHYGVSGPLILSGSSYVAKQKKYDNMILKIDLKPALTIEQLDKRILRDFEEFSNKNFKNSLDKLLPQKMIPVIIRRTNINPEKKVHDITKEERLKLVNILKGFTLTICGLMDYNEAIITMGGVSVKDINPATMESKYIKGMYFAGEVMDVDALTGGYNLQIAWSTGYLAGKSIY
ncbi:MAG: NAD(P)/FAD-dependent oxidoreductase [Eubacterium sp.]